VSRSTKVRRSKQSRQLRVCLLGCPATMGWQRDNLSRAGAWEAARGCEYLELAMVAAVGEAARGVVVLRVEVGGGGKMTAKPGGCLGGLVCCSLGLGWQVTGERALIFLGHNLKGWLGARSR
jgi:hypothetical protein